MVEPRPHPEVSDPPGCLCWRRSDRRRYSDVPAAHAELVVLHALQGDAEYLLDGRVNQLQVGTLLWAFAGQSHVLLRDSPDFDMWVFLISDRVLSPALANGTELPLLRLGEGEKGVEPRIVSPKASGELSSLAARIAACASPEVRLVGLRWWLAEAWRHWQASRDGLSRNVHPAVQEAVRLLRDDPTIALSQVSNTVGLSQGRLGKLFRAQVGQGLLAYRTQQRLARAEMLIQASANPNLLHVALDAGFGSYTQFYRAWCAENGSPPRDAVVSPQLAKERR